MDFEKVFDVYSIRLRTSGNQNTMLRKTFRNRVLMLCVELIKNETHIWSDIHKKFRYLKGEISLGTRQGSTNYLEELDQFLKECDDAHFLDFIEYFFQSVLSFHFGDISRINKIIYNINQFFGMDDLPYYLTQFDRLKKYDINGLCSFEEILPKVIRKDDEIMHKSAIVPVLNLLKQEYLSSANKEFLEALRDYRNRDFGDCLTKCCSAFESTMKIICDRNQWEYAQTDTAAKLIKNILKNSNLDKFFEHPLTLIATMRNKLSSSHGAGKEDRNINEHTTKYMINLTAASILLLVEECCV